MITAQNPFRETIASTAWRGSCPDVSEVHAQAFEECLRGLEHVRAARTSTGLLIHGEAGSGKTHLLGRLRERLTTSDPVSTDRLESLFVWVRLQTSPRAIWRHLRRQLVEDLLRADPSLKPNVADARPSAERTAKSQFERILFHRLAEVRPAEGDLDRWVDYMREHKPDGLDAALEEIAERIELDFNTTTAFKHLAFGRHKRELKAWLSGDSLPEAALERLELTAEDGSEEDREQVARQLVQMLCRLAGNNLPIALCFDQVEALQVASDDREGLFAFGQLVSTLHDESANLLIVSCMQSSFANDLKTRSRGADYDRMTSWGSQMLQPLTVAQAEKVIAARLAAVGARGLWPLSPGWPLGADLLQQLVAQGSLTPRRLLTLCTDAFDRWASGKDPAEALQAAPVIDPTTAAETLAESLGDQWEQRLDAATSSNTPARTNDIVRTGLPVLLKVVAPKLKTVRDDHLQDVELIFEGENGKVGLSLCTQANFTSLASRLKKLKAQWASGRLKKLIILRDSRVPIPKTSKQCLSSLDELRTAGAVVNHIAPETLIALDVLQGLMADAKSGDLSVRGDVVSHQSVEDWLRSQMSSCLQTFAEQFTDLSAAPVAVQDVVTIETLAALLESNPVIALSELLQAAKVSEAQVRSAIDRHPNQFRLLAGPPAVVFRAS